MRILCFLWLLLGSLAQAQTPTPFPESISTSTDFSAHTISELENEKLVTGSFDISGNNGITESLSFQIEQSPNLSHLTVSEKRHFKEEVSAITALNGEQLPIYVFEDEDHPVVIPEDLTHQYTFARIHLSPEASLGLERAERFRSDIQKPNKPFPKREKVKIETIDHRLARFYMTLNGSTVVFLAYLDGWTLTSTLVTTAAALSMTMMNTVYNQRVNHWVNRGLERASGPMGVAKNVLITAVKSIPWDMGQAFFRNTVNKLGGHGIAFGQLGVDKFIGIVISGMFSGVKNFIFKTGDPNPSKDLSAYNRPMVFATTLAMFIPRTSEELMNVASVHDFPIHLAFHGIHFTGHPALDIPAHVFNAVYHLKASMLFGVAVYTTLSVTLISGTEWSINVLKKVNRFMLRMIYKKGYQELIEQEALEAADELALKQGFCRTVSAGEFLEPTPVIIPDTAISL